MAGDVKATTTTGMVVIASTLALVALFTVPVESLNCYTDVDMRVAEDCQMHTGCMKRYDIKSQITSERSCFLTPGTNDTCFVDSDGSGVCWCHSDLCNTGVRGAVAATDWSKVIAATLSVFWPLLASNPGS